MNKFPKSLWVVVGILSLVIAIGTANFFFSPKRKGSRHQHHMVMKNQLPGKARMELNAYKKSAEVQAVSGKKRKALIHKKRKELKKAYSE